MCNPGFGGTDDYIDVAVTDGCVGADTDEYVGDGYADDHMDGDTDDYMDGDTDQHMRGDANAEGSAGHLLTAVGTVPVPGCNVMGASVVP